MLSDHHTSRVLLFKWTTVVVVLILALQTQSIWARNVGKPPKKDKARSARWLVSSSEWGVLGVYRPGGKLFTNIISFSDGVSSQSERGNATGVPHFYLSTMDETARDLLKDPTASFSISEKASDFDARCGALDAQEPTCARITLMGKVVPIKNKVEQEFAKQALYSKHPAMERWPAGHKFAFYKMDIEEIFFLNEYGGASPIKVRDYLSVELKNEDSHSDDDDGHDNDGAQMTSEGVVVMAKA